MLWVFGSLALTAGLAGAAPPADAPGSFLALFPCAPDGTRPAVVVPYEPHEGDLVLYDDHSPHWRRLYHMAGTDMPDHSGIVVRLPDGRLQLLESAPDDGHLAGLHVCLLEPLPRLHQFEGTIFIRRIKCPLSPEQSARLTEFALDAQGKRYALIRMLLQGTPFRARGSWRKALLGKTDLHRSSYFCSELVVAAGTAAGLFDPKVHFANAMYPRDMIYDDCYDLSATWLPAGIWSPCAAPVPSQDLFPPPLKSDKPAS